MLSRTHPTPQGSGLSRTAWLICIIAAIGFAFDIYELLMLPLIVGPALRELGFLEANAATFLKGSSWITTEDKTSRTRASPRSKRWCQLSLAIRVRRVRRIINHQRRRDRIRRLAREGIEAMERDWADEVGADRYATFRAVLREIGGTAAPEHRPDPGSGS